MISSTAFLIVVPLNRIYDGYLLSLVQSMEKKQ